MEGRAQTMEMDGEDRMINKTKKDGNAINKTVTSELKANLVESKRELAKLRKQARELKQQVKLQKERVEQDECLITNYGTCQKSRDRLMALIDRGFSAEYILDRCVDFFSLPCPFDAPWELVDTDTRLLRDVIAGKIELGDIPRQCTVVRGWLI